MLLSLLILWKWSALLSRLLPWLLPRLVLACCRGHFFNLETRMRISPIQSRTSRRDREFLTLNLKLRDETEKRSPSISGIETRSRFIIFILRLRDENENSLELISVFETRTRILKVATFPWIQAWMAHYFASNFWEANYIKCRALHFAWCSPILKWPSHVQTWNLWNKFTRPNFRVNRDLFCQQ